MRGIRYVRRSPVCPLLPSVVHCHALSAWTLSIPCHQGQLSPAFVSSTFCEAMLEKVSASGAVAAAQRHQAAERFTPMASSFISSLGFQASATSETRLRLARFSTRHSHCRVARSTRHSETSRNALKFSSCSKSARATRQLFRPLKKRSNREIFTTSCSLIQHWPRCLRFPSRSIGRVQIGYISSPPISNREFLCRSAFITTYFTKGYGAVRVAEYMHLPEPTALVPSGGVCVHLGHANEQI